MNIDLVIMIFSYLAADKSYRKEFLKLRLLRKKIAEAFRPTKRYLTYENADVDLKGINYLIVNIDLYPNLDAEKIIMKNKNITKIKRLGFTEENIALKSAAEDSKKICKRKYVYSYKGKLHEGIYNLVNLRKIYIKNLTGTIKVYNFPKLEYLTIEYFSDINIHVPNLKELNNLKEFTLITNKNPKREILANKSVNINIIIV